MGCQVLLLNDGKWCRHASPSPYPLWQHEDPQEITHRTWLKKLIECGVAETKEVSVYHNMN